METVEQYKKVINEIVSKQTVILGPQIALLKARNVSELSFNDAGEVLEIKGDPNTALQKLIDQYVELSGQIVKNALQPIFQKYPNVKSGLEK